MKEELKQTAEAIASHPKTAVAVTAAANWNVWWLDYGEPFVKASTSVLGLVILVLLIIKHGLDIRKHLKKEK